MGHTFWPPPPLYVHREGGAEGEEVLVSEFGMNILFNRVRFEMWRVDGGRVYEFGKICKIVDKIKLESAGADRYYWRTTRKASRQVGWFAQGERGAYGSGR